MATLHIIQGFLGAGKSTFSRKLAQEINAVRFNADEWVAAHFSADEQEKDWEACFSKGVVDMWEKSRAVIASGNDAILDMGFWSRESRDYARAKAKEFGATLKLYYVFAPDDVLLARIRQRTGPIADRNAQNFHEYKKFFEEPGPDEGAILINNYDEKPAA